MNSLGRCSAARQKGAVSIFLVIFVALVVAVMTVAFVRVALRDRQLAINQDLSQSAYDAALAGVEDGKRALLRYFEATDAQRSTLPLSLVGQTPGNCSTVSRIVYRTGTDDPEGGRPAVSGTSGNDMEQAYTCATLTNKVSNFQVDLERDEQVLFPLPDDAESIRIEWAHAEKDGNGGATPFTVPDTLAPTTLPAYAAWAPDQPALLEAQFVQTGTNFTLDQFDNSAAPDRSNANTLFLYPARLSTNPSLNFFSDGRRIGGSPTHPTAAQCLTTPNPAGDGVHSCATTIVLPQPHGGTAANRFLRLAPRYNSTSVKVTALRADGSVVDIENVQAEVDVTGRANDVYRRIAVRLDTPAVIYPGTSDAPGAAVNIRGNLCKTFSVAADPSDYGRGGCDPNQP